MVTITKSVWITMEDEITNISIIESNAGSSVDGEDVWGPLRVGSGQMGSSRLFSVVSQMGVCTLVAIAFLILGSTLLDVLFPDTFSKTFWITFMALMVIPVCLIPTLKESAFMAFAGCMGTAIADIIAVSILQWNMRGHPSIPKPNATAHQILTCFGNLAVAYGAAIAIPDLQREFSQPPREKKEKYPYVENSTPLETSGRPITASSLVEKSEGRMSHLRVALEFGEEITEEQLRESFKGAKIKMRYITLRITMIVIMVIVAVEQVPDLEDFTGATAHTVNCMLMPVLIYMLVFWRKISILDKGASDTGHLRSHGSVCDDPRR
ncbi:unnamed protein product [Phytophthora fragariaefolia]|uniref:Unnamed protein product n=1 Tax=Phytophthora fragariaefolia TaxID=1490495 RepID=A0A9W6Y1P7_9STRA|nr:unnamed protein product [Phytophthora fragariaefolia]